MVSHTEAGRMLRRAGYSSQEIEDLLRNLPDPIDSEREATELLKRGITLANLTDRRGGSP
jgi:hypothetical protein